MKVSLYDTFTHVRKGIEPGLSLYFKEHLHQLYEIKVYLYDTFTHVRKGGVKFDLTWRKWVVKLRKWELNASFTPPLRSLKFLFSCCEMHPW